MLVFNSFYSLIITKHVTSIIKKKLKEKHFTLQSQKKDICAFVSALKKMEFFFVFFKIDFVNRFSQYYKFFYIHFF
jgi:hypothetical protein